MRLVFASVQGYKRFRDKQRVDLDGPLIAIVGANEAGKSSLLRALYRIEDEDGFSRDEPTRRTTLSPNERVVQLDYLLDDDDRRAALSTVAPGDEQPRWMRVFKYGDGRVRFLIEPRPRQRFDTRAEELQLLVEFLEVSPEVLADDESESTLVQQADIDVLKSAWADSETEKLDDAAVEAARRVESALRQQGTDEATAIAERLGAGAEREEMPSPHQRAIYALAQRRPRLLQFDSGARDLPTEFDLAELENAPTGLRNLARLASLDLELLYEAIQSGDTAYAAELLGNANARLSEVFREWNQFDVSVQFDRGDGALLIVHVTTDTNGLSRLEERSEGLKAFAALVAMVGTAPTVVPPIVLIDEVELHLHYDAEADLIRFFGEQSAVAQVIYTTHSPGCLPGDFGTGVRVVQRIADTADSEVRNRFWTEDQGFRPILYAMGAATLSFVPLRAAVIAEGASELIVLPSLLREATGKRVLPFHVTAGAAEVRPARIAGLDLEAPRVVYLLDADDGGNQHREKLLAAGIPEARVLSVSKADVVLEDLVQADVYVEAVNRTLSRYTENRFPTRRLTKTRRPAAVAKWCKEIGISPPGKIQVSHAILEQRAEHALVAPDRRELLLELYERIADALELAE